MAWPHPDPLIRNAADNPLAFLIITKGWTGPLA